MPMYLLNDIVEVQLLVQSNSGVFMNQVYFRMKANTPQPNTLSTQIRDFYWSSYGLIISVQLALFGVKSRKVDPSPKSTYVQETLVIRQGLVSGNVGAEGLSNIIVLRHANQFGRSGRMYSPGPPQGAYFNGAMDPVHIGRLNNCVNGLNAAFAQGGSNTFLEQRVKTRINNFTSPLYLPVQQFDWRPFMGWQRSRGRGRGI